MIDDDALDGRLFRARPDTPLRGAPLTGEQEELLASIMASAGVARPRRARGSKTVLERWSLAAALLLVLGGAFTKSAQFPFHFWLPNAMEAPTPVSAYLHSATRV